MVKFSNFFKFGKKSAKRFSADYHQSRQPIATDSESIPLKDYLSTDPDLAANVRRFVDNVLIEKPIIVASPDSKLADSTLKNYNKQLGDVRFYKLMRAALYHLVWNGNAFFEIKFSGTRLKEMYVIDPDTIEIVKNPANDKVMRYEQNVNGSPVAKFQPEEIIHISIDHLDNGEWGHAFMKPLKQALKRKEIAEFYLQWLIQNNKFAPIINVKSELVNDEQWKHIIHQLNAKSVDPDFYQIIGTFPDDEVELLKFYTTENFDRITQYIEKQNEQIITLLQVPPIISGTVDNSNRSNSEIQARFVFFNTIRAFQNLIVEELNFEMIRKLQWKNVEFKFPAIDERINVELLKLAKTMRTDLGFTQEAIREFLRENGFKLPKVKKMFEDNPAAIAIKGARTENTNSAPSREPRDKSGLVQNEAKRLEDREMGVSSNAN